MTPCQHYSELISCLIDGELTNVERESVLGHIAECERCRALYNAFAAVSSASGEELEEVPEDLRENIMANIRREEIRRNNTRKKHIRTTVSAAACLALIITAAFAASPLLRRKGSVEKLSADYKTSVTEAAPEAPAVGGAIPETFLFDDSATDFAVPEAVEEEAAAVAESLTEADAAPIQESAEPESANSRSILQVYELSPDADIEQLNAYLSGSPAQLPEREPDNTFAVSYHRDGEPCIADVCIFDEQAYFSFNSQDFNLSDTPAHELIFFLQAGGK